MQRLEVSGAVRPIYGSLGVKRLTYNNTCHETSVTDASNPKKQVYYKWSARVSK